MNKKFLLEQLNRAKFCALDELKFHEKYDKFNTWMHHENGHLELIGLIRDWISHDEVIDVKNIKKLIRNRVKFNCDTIKEIDKKYYEDEDADEEMSEDDNFLYHFSDGMNCEAGVFLRILNKKYYYNKGVYIPTNWDEFMGNK